MGRFALELLAASERFVVELELDHEDDLDERLSRADVTLGLDFTVAGRGFEHGRAMIAAGVRPVIGTSGVTPEENAELDRLARERGLGGLVVPNFSLGILLLQRFAALAAEAYGSCEIVELHHDGKRDVPSGTALRIAELVDAVRAPADGAVPIHSVRLPGLYAHHEVLFGGAGETLGLRHDMSGPAAFGPGILLALEHALTAEGVGRGLEVAVGGDFAR